MTFRSFFLFLLSLCPLLSTALAQDRAPHGLAYQNPMAFSPSAYEFFHPNARRDPCATSNCSPLPIAAQVHETESQEDTTPNMSSHRMGVGVVIGPLFGILVIVFLAMGAYYLAKTRRENSGRAKAVQPNV